VTTVYFVVPDSVLDPLEPSGGNVYDRILGRGLVSAGRQVREHAVRGGWPQPDADALLALETELATVPDAAAVIVDGLVASAAPRQMQALGARACLVVLLHMPLSATGEGCADAAVRGAERTCLLAAAAVVTTSSWSRDHVVAGYGIDPSRVHVAIPGARDAPVAPGSAGGSELLCVAAVTEVKGQDLLLAALAEIRREAWRCTCLGSLNRDRAFVAKLEAQTAAFGLRERFLLKGARVGSSLDEAYAAADAVVLPSRLETYGMVVTEALARGLPVIAAAVGGVPEAMGVTDSDDRPGLLVPPGDPAALAGALRSWLTDASLRRRLRQAALARRAILPRWQQTVDAVTGALDAAGA
jgi:glycosyltransferase involved in cell wall biosynthesis